MASIKIKNPAYTEGGSEPKWLTIPMYAKMNPFEVLNITLMSNIPAPDRSMYGADITVVTADGIKILDTDWFGQPITLNIDEGVTYTVTVSVSDCYTAQEELSFTFTATSNNIRNLNIHYKANGIKVNMVNTAGASINKPATITYMSEDNEESVEVYHGEIAALPLGVEATITFPQIDGCDVPEPYTFIVTKDTVEYTATYSIAGITKIRINHNISDPDTMIELIEDTGGIEKIRANSHLYTGEVVDGVMLLRQLIDETGAHWLDGTLATISTPGIDVWMKLPLFWYKVEIYYADIYDISFSISKIDDTWNEWDGKDLIGAYLGYYENDQLYSCFKLWSSKSLTDAKVCASNRGDGFRITLYKHHCIIQWLCYAYYRKTNTNLLLNYITTLWSISQTPDNIFHTNSKVTMQDASFTLEKVQNTYGTTPFKNIVLNIWGLEGWIGPYPEFIGNVTVLDDKLIIFNDDNTETTIPKYVEEGWISYMIPKENLLTIPYETNASSSTFYCSYINFNNTKMYLARNNVEYVESAYLNNFSSVSSLLLVDDVSNVIYETGLEYHYASRLTYRGDWVIID